MASISISISASKLDEADSGQETDELALAQGLVQKLKDDGFSVTGSFYGVGGSTPLTGTAEAESPAGDAASEPTT